MSFLRLFGAYCRSRAFVSRAVAVLSFGLSVVTRAVGALSSGRAVLVRWRLASLLGGSRVVGARARVAVGVGWRWSAGRLARRRRRRSCALARRARRWARCRRSRSRPSRRRVVGHGRSAVGLHWRARSAAVGWRPCSRQARAAFRRRSFALLSSARARRSSAVGVLARRVAVVSCLARWTWRRAPSVCAGVVVSGSPRARPSRMGGRSALAVSASVAGARAGARAGLRPR